MTKEEFLKMLDKELDVLTKEYQAAEREVNYWKAVKPNGDEYKEAEYRFKMVNSKIMVLKAHMSLPAYTRIQAMSEAEIEEYKNSKIAELELKIEDLNAQEKDAQEKLSQLKAAQKLAIERFGKLSDRDQAQAVYEGKELAKELSEYDVNNPYGIFEKIKKAKEALRKQQEKIKAMTSQEIKQQLSSEIAGSGKLYQTIEWAKSNYKYSEPLESVASDPTKARQLANLLANSYLLSKQKGEIRVSIYLGYGNLPRVLDNNLRDCGWYESKTGYTNNPNELMKIVEEFEGSFKQAKSSFNEEFTEKKLSKLVEYNDKISENVDMEFLRQHRDKLGVGELRQLENLVEQRDRLSKKLLKTKATKIEIEALNNRIKEAQSQIYKKIIGWYKSQSKDILGIVWDVEFYSLEALRASLSRCNEDIRRSAQAIEDVKESIKRSINEYEAKKIIYETREKEIKQQIENLAGEEYRVPSYSGIDLPSKEKAETYIEELINSATNNYIRGVVNRVQQEAQNQADMREAELRGIAVEQLLQMRSQVATDGLNNGTGEHADNPPKKI